MRSYSLLALSVLLVAGCARTPQQSAPAAAKGARDPGPSNEMLFDLLKEHGEKEIISDVNGVGIRGNVTRIRGEIQDSKPERNGYLVETEFRIRLPEGREILEYVAGVGDTQTKAENDGVLNFVLTTFHPIYKTFINPADPHQPIEKLKMANGDTREVALGDIVVRGATGKAPLDLDHVHPLIKAAIQKAPLMGGPHWIKIVYSQAKSKPLTASATLDNFDNADLAAAVKQAPWPRREEVYIAKQFIVIK